MSFSFLPRSSLLGSRYSTLRPNMSQKIGNTILLLGVQELKQSEIVCSPLVSEREDIFGLMLRCGRGLPLGFEGCNGSRFYLRRWGFGEQGQFTVVSVDKGDGGMDVSGEVG